MRLRIELLPNAGISHLGIEDQRGNRVELHTFWGEMVGQGAKIVSELIFV